MDASKQEFLIENHKFFLDGQLEILDKLLRYFRTESFKYVYRTDLIKALETMRKRLLEGH